MKVPILLPNIFNHPFTYESDIDLKVGDYVVVPFGKSKITGIVWDELVDWIKKIVLFFFIVILTATPLYLRIEI